MRAVSILKHAYFEVDYEEAQAALGKGNPGDMFACNRQYMYSQNNPQRIVKAGMAANAFTTPPVVRKRRCRICRTHRMLAGSSRGARHRTPGGIIVDAAFRGANPEPLTEVIADDKAGYIPFLR